MQFKPAGSEKKFSQYIFRQICDKGGTRMQMVASDLANLMQKNLDAVDDVNLYRKSFGNLEQCLKQIKNPFFILDAMVVKFRKKEDIDLLFQQGHIAKDDYQLYLTTYAENEKKIIQTMKFNNQNECKNCGTVYNVLANAVGNCPKNEQKHEPKHNF